MKKLFLLVITLFLFNAGFSQSTIPNGDLENWYQVTVSSSLKYWQPGTGPSDNWLATLNELASIPAPIGPGPVTVFRTDTAYTGSYAARLTSDIFFLSPSNVFIPGMLGTAKLDNPNVRAILGRPCPGCKPLHFTGYYQFYPVNGDSCSALLLVSKWNSSMHKRDTVGYGKQLIKNATSTYTPFDVEVKYNYPASSFTPDSMTLLVVSSDAFSLVNFMGAKGQVGNTMYVDDLQLQYPAGIQQLLMPKVSVNIYPNPVHNILNMELGQRIENAVAEIFNSAGQSLAIFDLRDKKNSLPVYMLGNGTYYFQVRTGDRLLNTGSFMIVK